MKHKIINIDDRKCDGCGMCVPDCHEGALQIIEGKARLVSDLFCDGLGACIGSCPNDAITILEREAEPYDEKRVMDNLVKQGMPVIQAHLEHLESHGESGLYREAIEYLKDNGIRLPGQETTTELKMQHKFHACPGSASMAIEREPVKENAAPGRNVEIKSELRQWPVQLMLLNPAAPYFDNADLLICADCVPFAYGDFHRDFLAGKIAVMFCPKLDPHIDEYIEKMTAILSNHKINSITILRMEVPCCGGVNYVIDQALERSGKEIPYKEYVISIKGEAA